MRIISGSRKGLRLKTPKNQNIRPTQDRIKESLFNILGIIDENSIVLDLYAGTGNIGIEFLSRGAMKCYFIDNSYEGINLIRENINISNFNEKSYIYKKDVLKSLDFFSKNGIVFDYIFMDPPYRQNLPGKTLEIISKKNVLKDNGIVVVEHEKKLSLGNRILNLIKTDERDYGDKIISFYSLITEGEIE